MNNSHEANFEAIVRHSLLKVTGEDNVDNYYYKILIRVVDQQILAEKAGITQTKVEAFRTIISKIDLKRSLN